MQGVVSHRNHLILIQGCASQNSLPDESGNLEGIKARHEASENSWVAKQYTKSLLSL